MVEIKKGNNRFYIGETEDTAIAEIFYKPQDDDLVADHTYVSDELRGQNIAKQLLNKLVEMAREENKKIVPVCSYVVAQFNKSDEYDDVKR